MEKERKGLEGEEWGEGYEKCDEEGRRGGRER